MRRAFLALLGPALTVCLAMDVRACSQCMCGTPFPADALGGVVPMQIRYGFEERYLSKSNGLDEGPGEEREREHRVSGFVLWRAANRLALLGRLPYNVKEITETPQGEISKTQRAHGLGDAEALALIGLIHGAGPSSATVGLVLGVTAPTGPNNRRDRSGERLDAHLQPGTGAWSGTAGLNFAVAFAGGTLDASALGRASEENAHGYRYGNVVLYNAGYTTPARNGWQLVAQLNGRSAGRDRFEDGSMGQNTGGTVVYAAPGVRWQSGVGVGVEGAVQVPLVKSLFGDQDEHATARLALSLSR